MKHVNAIIADLRDRKLWPVAVGLLLAIVAVPIVLSHTATPAPEPPLPSLAMPVSGPATGAPVTAAAGAAAQQPLGAGHARDPFTQQTFQILTSAPPTASGASASASSGSPAGAITIGTPPSRSTGGTSSASASGGAGAGVIPVLPPPAAPGTITPTPPSTPVEPPAAPTGLAATQGYHVAISVTDAEGGTDLIDPVERLSPVPSLRQPLLLELGVAQGGDRVLFAVQPGTMLNGPGTCTPGPLDCEIVSLAPGQTEALSAQSPMGVTAAGLFAVTGVTTDQYSSSAQARSARSAVSQPGSDLFSKLTLDALALFRYDPSAGTVIDLRNLTVGGSK